MPIVEPECTKPTPRDPRDVGSGSMGPAARRFNHSSWLRMADQACCAGLVIFGLAAMAISFAYQGGLRGRLIDVEKAVKRPLRFQLDINRADWPEWSVLPGIGEMLAKRIVQSRQLNGPFRSHDDLQRVHGIGPKTVERIREYLLPMEEVQK
jgi:competence protein ComEA